MFYVYSILIPIVILVFKYFIVKPKPKELVQYLDLLIKTLPYIYGYVVLLYFLAITDYLDVGWAFYSLMVFLIPISLLALGVRKYYRDKE